MGRAGGAATASPEESRDGGLGRVPLGSNPGAGCCTAACPEATAKAGAEGRKSGRVEGCRPPRGAPGKRHVLLCEVLCMRPAPLLTRGGHRFFDNLGPQEIGRASCRERV